MPPRTEYPTPYPEVNALADRLLQGVTGVLGDQFVGLYLHGSLALGDFDPARSDIDFMVATAGELPAEAVSALEALHAGITDSDLAWKRNYEGSYIPLAALRRFDPACSQHPAVEVDGHFGLAEHGIDWVIQRHVLREWGVAVSGPPPDSLIDPIAPNALRQAALRVALGRWAPEVEEAPGRFADAEYQAYAVLTMCRTLFTLRFGAVTSKPKAARWAQERLGPRWAGLVERAMAWRHGAQLDACDQTRAFVRYALDLARTQTQTEL